jgi:hypothetical protein
MKTKIFALTIAILGITAVTSFAQNTASATASASGTIVTPIAITKNVDLNFGNIASGTAGTVTLEASAAATRTPSAGITLPAGNTGTVTAAKFTVTGAAGYAYTFTVPSTATTITRQSGTETMTVDAFTSNAGTTITGGSVEVYVGATLHVGANQVAGVYTSATPFTVTVNYN